MRAGRTVKTAAAILAAAALSFGITPIEHNGQLKVNTATGKVVNKNSYPVQLRGMSSHGLQWFPEFMNPTAFTALRDNWGADIVRLSMYIQEEGYETNPAEFTALMDRLINEVTAAGLYVLVDFHQLKPGDPNFNINHAKTFFEHIASTHSAKTNILYEICNEPNDETGTVTWSMIKTYANTIIPIIRKYDTHNIIVVGTPEWDQRPDLVINSRVSDPLGGDNILYTVHFYAASHGEYELDVVKQAVAAKIPVIVTECGTQEASGDGANDFTASEMWFDYLDANKISWVNWNFSSDERTGAVFNTSNQVSKSYYESDSNLKEAGLWIKNRMKTPDDWGTVVVDTAQYMVTVVGGTGSGKYRQGDKVTITASKAGADSVFVKWNGDVGKVTGTLDSAASFTMVNSALTFTAQYGPAPVWSEDLLDMNGSWKTAVDTKGSAAAVDSSASDGSIDLALTLANKGTKAQADLSVPGDYSRFSKIKISYSSDNAVNCILVTAGGNFTAALPASSDTTVELSLSSFTGTGTLVPSAVTGISFGAVKKGAKTAVTLSDIRISAFTKSPIAISSARYSAESIKTSLSGNRVTISGLNSSVPVEAVIYGLNGRVLFSTSLRALGETSLNIPEELNGSGISILSISNGSAKMSQKILLK